jgi:hypothetical protein
MNLKEVIEHVCRQATTHRAFSFAVVTLAKARSAVGGAAKMLHVR